MSLTLDRFLTVKQVDSPSAVQTQDQSLAVYATDQYSDQFIEGLYLYASSQIEVEQIFGTDSEIAKATAKAFGHANKPKQVIIAYWNKTGAPIIARPNSLTATQSPATFSVQDGEYTITLKSRNITETQTIEFDDQSFTNSDDFEALATKLNTSFGETSKFTFSYADGVFSVRSKVNGKDVDTDDIVYDGAFADELRLTPSRGVKQIRGINGSTPSAQTATALISELEEYVPGFYGFYSSVDLSDTEIEEFSDRLYSALKPHVFAYTVQSDYMLDFEQSNPVYRIAQKNNRRNLFQLNKLNDKHAAVQLLVEACSTNWEARNTAKTMKFKRQPMNQSDSGVTTTMANKADRLGVNYYTDYDGTSFLAEGRTVGTEIFFIDSTVGRDALVDRVKSSVATRLIQAPKVPQTDEGQVSLLGACLQPLEQFVNNGFIGQGLTWNSTGFGELSTGDVLERGYYIYSDSYTLQSQSDREARKAMPIQIAVKEAGAIHSADIIITVER